MTDLTRLGIRVEAHGDRLRYSPRSAVTPDLADRMKSHKGELLAILRGDPEAPAIDLTNATAVWQAALDRLEGDPLFPPDVMEALRAADARWADDPEAGEAAEVIDPPTPCPRCGTLELWQTLAGNWRCLRCDPPATAPRVRELAARLKRPHRFAQDERKGPSVTQDTKIERGPYTGCQGPSSHGFAQQTTNRDTGHINQYSPQLQHDKTTINETE